MSSRYHRGHKYQTRNSQAAHSPLRSIPLFRPAAAVFGTSWYDGTWNQPKAAPAVEVAPIPAAAPAGSERALRNAEANLRDAQRVYDDARKGIDEANRTRSEAVVVDGRIVMSSRPLTPDRIRERKSAAFKLFNKRRKGLAAAKRALATIRTVPDGLKDGVRLPVQAPALSSALTMAAPRPALLGPALAPSPAARDSLLYHVIRAEAVPR